MSLLVNLFAGVLAAALLIYFYVTRHLKYWSSRGVEGPRPTPFFGNFKEVLYQTVTPGKFLGNIYNAAAGAPYVGFFILDKPILLLRDPDVIKQVLIKDFNSFVDRYADSSFKSDSLGTRGMFLSKGTRWRQLRTALSPVFTSGRMKKMFYLMLECGTELKSHLNTLLSKTATASVEVKELMAKTSTDVITTCAFGINSNCISDPEAEFREFGRSIFIYTFRRSLESTAMWFMPWLCKAARMSFYPPETANFLHTVFWDTIKARETSGVPRHDVIDQLIQLKNKGRMEDDEKIPGKTQEEKSPDLALFNFHGEDLLAQAALFFAAGFETTASTLSFTLYELALHPEVQTRVRKEINQVMARHEGQVTYEGVIEMKYLDACLAETLRKYPPLPFLDRICLKDYVVPSTGLKIEKGTPLFIPLLGLHYDPEYFPDPEKYDPERFSEENKHSFPSCSYLPFGEGPRLCIGMRFAQIAAKTDLASVLARLEVLPCPDTPVPIVLNPKATLLASVGGIPLLFKLVEE